MWTKVVRVSPGDLEGIQGVVQEAAPEAEVAADDEDDEIEYMPPKMQGQLTQYIPFSD